MDPISGRYRLEKEIGRGSASVVYLAYDERTHGQCALKILRARLIPPAVRARFSLEAQVMSTVFHRHILKVFDHDLERKRPWMAMPWVRAGCIRQHLDRSGPLPMGDAIVHGIEALGALAAAHDAGVVHRDIKPSNLLKSPTGVRVTDFGIAAMTMDDHDPGPGSMAFMAPEQRAGAIDPRSDLYGLGVSLFLMVGGQNPFDLHREDELGPRLQPLGRLRSVVVKATRGDPEERYATAREMAEALLQAAVGSTFQAHAQLAYEQALASRPRADYREG